MQACKVGLRFYTTSGYCLEGLGTRIAPTENMKAIANYSSIQSGRILIYVLAMAFAAQACSSGGSEATSDKIKSNPIEEGSTPVIPRSSAGDGTTYRAAQAEGSSAPTSPSANDSDHSGNSKEIKTMFWVLGSIAAVGAVIAIAYLTGTAGKREATGDQNSSPKKNSQTPSSKVLSSSDMQLASEGSRVTPGCKPESENLKGIQQIMTHE